MDGKRKGLSGSDVVVTRSGESIRSIRLASPQQPGCNTKAKLKLKGEIHIQMKPDQAEEVSAQTTRTKFDGVLLTIRSRKSFFEVTQAIEMALPRFHIPKLMEYVTHGDRAGVEAYVDSTSKPFSIFWDFEQGSTMRLAGIPIESKFYLVGNAVIARGLFEYSGAAGLGAPVRICVSQRDGEQTRIDMDNQLSFFSKFTEMKPSSVPALLDEKLTKFFEEIAA
jgi:uncharacterized protein (DUF302 family)